MNIFSSFFWDYNVSKNDLSKLHKMDVEKFLCDELSKKLSSNSNIKSNKDTNMADNLVTVCNSFYEKPVHSFGDLKLRNTKVKGDIFEEFTKKYLLHVYKLHTVYLLKEVPAELLDKLGLKRKDYGIDLIGIDENGRYYAIQAKYRKRCTTKKTVVSWKQLSTFYSLCARTGPWQKLVVCTTADYICRQGKKNSKDYSITWNKIKNINHFDWLSMVEYKSARKIGTEKPSSPLPEQEKVDPDKVRAARLAYFQNSNLK